METIQILKKPVAMLRYAGHQLLGGRWGDLAEQVAGYEKVLRVVPAPIHNVVRFPHGLTLKDPIEHGWNPGDGDCA